MTPVGPRQYGPGLDRYDMARDPIDGRPDKVLPIELGAVHAFWKGAFPDRRRPVSVPEFLSSGDYDTALCGTRVKVRLPGIFDPGDPDSCLRCVGPSLRGELPPHEGVDDD